MVTPPRTIMRTVYGFRIVRDPLVRRLALGLAAVVFFALALWPRPYLAVTQLLPNDSATSLSTLLGGGGGSAGGLLSSLFGGGRQSIEVDLVIARSQPVAEEATALLQKQGFLRGVGFQNAVTAVRHAADIETIRGSILQISVTDHDPRFAKAVADDYIVALHDRISKINLGQTGERRRVAEDRMREITTELADSQQALDRFRQDNRLAAPEAQLGPAISLLTGLQGSLQAEQASLATLSRFATSNNVQVQAARAQIAALESQIAAAREHAGATGDDLTVGGLTPQLTRYQNLFRDEKVAEAKYEIYRRYLESVTVEELSAPINMDVLSPPFVTPDRQFNPAPMGALVLVIMLFVISEFYLAGPPRVRRAS